MTSIQLANHTWNQLSDLAKQRNLSLNDFLEKIIQGQLAIIDADELEDLRDVHDAIVAESDPDNAETIPWNVVKQELGYQ
ncbi:MAG: ribbon-helix-helix domain-containing protein [Snowella sp.]|nr:ribbon-helix-helix domain-containing protein [Snowella sp.]